MFRVVVSNPTLDAAAAIREALGDKCHIGELSESCYCDITPKKPISTPVIRQAVEQCGSIVVAVVNG
jgi:hypothetical protein